MSNATPTLDPAQNEPYSEFLKALDIIEDTQLTMFSETPVPGRQETISEYLALVEASAAELDKTSEDYTQQYDAICVRHMRGVLFSNIAGYNDKYANYIYPDALKRYQARRNGNFVGLGIKYRAVANGYPLAIGALSGGPMDGKDIKPGDRIISVDDQSLRELSSRQIEQIFKGPVDSVATVEVARADSRHRFEIKRTAVDLRYADAELIASSVGYIKISRFGSNTHLHVNTLLAGLIEKGASCIVLDLRDNPGGSTRAARAIVSMFTSEQHIYCEKYKNGEIQKLPRHGEHKTDLPLAVLINSQSMSCSEVVAGAIQSYQRGVIVGVTSFGKGLIQRVFNLAEPLGGAVRTTIAVMTRPDQKPIHATGITPDLQVKSDSDFMFRRTGSLNISSEARAFQRTLLEHDVRKKYPERASEFIEAADKQLQAAVDHLLDAAGER